MSKCASAPAFRQPNPLRQAFLFKLETDFVGRYVGKLLDARGQPQNEEHSRVGAERHARIAAFDLE